MKKTSTIIISLLLAITLFACTNTNTLDKYKDAIHITFKDGNAYMNELKIKEYDYTWHVDPSSYHEEVKNAPAEYYTGTKPDTNDICYIDHELYYYPMLDKDKFKLINYDGEKEWAYYYEDGINNDYIFSTLPNFNDFPSNMMHTKEEALKNKVLHITKAGVYVLEGDWLGQINIDLGDKDTVFKDSSATVTIVLNNVNITCSVAPAVVFVSTYECDNAWSEKDKHSWDVETNNAGVNIVIGDDTTNTIKGENIYRMLKPVYKDEESKDTVKVQKKIRKIDSPLYSYVSMNIDGEDKDNGILNIKSSFEGLGSELHLTILGGNITIDSNDDGINTNEDDVSVCNLKGGEILINAAKGQEGDGIDSNGYIVVDGTNLTINNIRMPDNALDSSSGVIYNKGNVIVNGKEVKLEKGEYKEIGINSLDNQFRQGPPNDSFKDEISLFELKIGEIKDKINSLNDDITLFELIKIFNEDLKEFNNIEMPPFDKPSNEFDKKDRPEDMPNMLDTTINIKDFKDMINKLDDDTSIADVLKNLGIELDNSRLSDSKPINPPKQ